MRLMILAVGRLGSRPEAVLTEDWLRRATLHGRPLGLGPAMLSEVEPRKPGMAAEAEALLGALSGAVLVACDERGEAWPSAELARRVGHWRDQGERALAFAIGGADGLHPSVAAQARAKIAFGPQTWPHALARAMLAEQIYRAVTILAGSPYHRA